MNAGDFARQRALIEFKAHLKASHRGERFARKALRALVKRTGAALLIIDGKRIGYRMRDGSIACEKQRFRLQGAALAELSRIREHATHAHIPVRAYHCQWCGGWHLTSLE